MNYRYHLNRAKDFLESLRNKLQDRKSKDRHDLLKFDLVQSALGELDAVQHLLLEARNDNPKILAYVNMPDRDYPGDEGGVYRIIGVRIELNEFQKWSKSESFTYVPIQWLKERIEAGSKTLTFSPAQALCILKLRDALLARNYDMAWHWLKTLDSKQVPHDPFKPWADLERIAEQGQKDGTTVPG